jgi:hypothetical protein
MKIERLLPPVFNAFAGIDLNMPPTPTRNFEPALVMDPKN